MEPCNGSGGRREERLQSEWWATGAGRRRRAALLLPPGTGKPVSGRVLIPLSLEPLACLCDPSATRKPSVCWDSPVSGIERKERDFTVPGMQKADVKRFP